ncbi:hypothetical protein BC936DRAFT_139681 [Jimgerdemannia flammicorona]|uniref:Uncharacterized protein n=1 Tax=Jimgerdemannia flammicorona TaxID=994334 RepID=A0A433B9G1_9FUNG|nr:hypothetical protein BC936DRAFT_139681 [Jimgerdemannia flammicorona]
MPTRTEPVSILLGADPDPTSLPICGSCSLSATPRPPPHGLHPQHGRLHLGHGLVPKVRDGRPGHPVPRRWGLRRDDRRAPPDRGETGRKGDGAGVEGGYKDWRVSRRKNDGRKEFVCDMNLCKMRGVVICQVTSAEFLFLLQLACSPLRLL